MKYMWEGRFKDEILNEVIEFTKSIDIDKKLAFYDIKGSIAHAKMLAKVGLLTKEEEKEIIDGLKIIENEIKKNIFEIKKTDEDIHTAIERRLIEIKGDVGEKLHTARSRNDQIALDERLYLRDAIISIVKGIINVQKALLEKSEQYIDKLIPAYTHLKQSQVVLISHYLLSYIEKLERDKERFFSTYERVNILPLGVGACSGTTLNIDRKYVAELLNFPKITRNSLDTVSDRDFLLETLFNCVLTLIHLSSFSEDLIIWNMDEIEFINLPDNLCTGSSLMPHKKNPDILELIRGKTGISIGNLTGILCTLKSLPFSYNRDLQEDKKPLFETIEILISSLNILSKVIKNIKFNTEKIKNSISSFTLATDIAEYLVKKKIPFRKAHKIVGEIVNYCIKNKKDLFSLSLKEFKKFSKEFEEDIFNLLNFEKSANLKTSFGGTSIENVKKEIERWRKNLKNFSIPILVLKRKSSMLKKLKAKK